MTSGNFGSCSSARRSFSYTAERGLEYCTTITSAGRVRVALLVTLLAWRTRLVR